MVFTTDRIKQIKRKLLVFCFAALPLSVASCAGPASKIDGLAKRFAMRRIVVSGTSYQHVLYVKSDTSFQSVYDVYIEGDGTPWQLGVPSPDPTPRNPLVLRLMAQDSNPAIYLGRPCYLGFAARPPCSSADWTSGRYSEKVVGSMAAALENYRGGDPVGPIVLFGHSGGGTLAMLLAGRLRNVEAVVTINGDLDPDAWVKRHGLHQLTGSLNPTHQLALPSSIRQIHLTGSNDKVVPTALVRNAADSAAQVLVFNGFDHVCCWEQSWTDILKLLKELPPTPMPSGILYVDPQRGLIRAHKFKPP